MSGEEERCQKGVAVCRYQATEVLSLAGRIIERDDVQLGGSACLRGGLVSQHTNGK